MSKVKDLDTITVIKQHVLDHKNALLAANIYTIELSYAGDGDDGSPSEQLSCFDKSGNIISDTLGLTDNLYGRFVELHDDLASPTYMDNDGGGGSFSINVATGILKFESYFREIVETVDENREL